MFRSLINGSYESKTSVNRAMISRILNLLPCLGPWKAKHTELPPAKGLGLLQVCFTAAFPLKAPRVA